MNEIETLKNIEKATLAILMVLVDERISKEKDMDKDKRKTEILLADAGFKGPEISKIINKNLAAIQKTIQRGRK